MRRRCQNTRAGVLSEILIVGDTYGVSAVQLSDELREQMITARTQESVHFGKSFLKVVHITLRQTARDDEKSAFVFLVFSHFENGRYRLFLGFVYKCAGINYDHFCLRRIGRELIARFRKVSKHVFRIYSVFVAPQRHYSDFQIFLSLRPFFCRPFP